MKLQGWAVAGKAWVGLLGLFLTFIIPWVVQESDHLPYPWPLVIGAAVAVATAVGIYHAPYAPARPTAVQGQSGGNTPWPQD